MKIDRRSVRQGKQKSRAKGRAAVRRQGAETMREAQMGESGPPGKARVLEPGAVERRTKRNCTYRFTRRKVRTGKGGHWNALLANQSRSDSINSTFFIRIGKPFFPCHAPAWSSGARRTFGTHFPADLAQSPSGMHQDPHCAQWRGLSSGFG